MKKSEEERDSGIYSMCEEERETSYYGFEIYVSLLFLIGLFQTLKKNYH